MKKEEILKDLLKYKESLIWINSYVLQNKFHSYYNHWYWQRKEILKKIDILEEKLKKKL